MDDPDAFVPARRGSRVALAGMVAEGWFPGGFEASPENDMHADRNDTGISRFTGLETTHSASVLACCSGYHGGMIVP
ncbi:hypothetical protein [Yoonia sp. SS1-5]|uniref:Uncharacterized protein n=1 Tax=Yoonia rhodophyticola TaxID=3137370 RepID=A0AAN0M9B3_9RHOB